MSRLTELLGAPRVEIVTLKNGAAVRLAELSLAVTWPYLNGEPVNPDVLVRASVVDENGEPAIASDDAIPFAAALELLPYILKMNDLESDAGEAGAVRRDFPKAAPAA